jgi:hypothetical protein
MSIRSQAEFEKLRVIGRIVRQALDKTAAANYANGCSRSPVSDRILGYCEGAWRSVGYVIPDETGTPMWMPVEAFEKETQC